MLSGGSTESTSWIWFAITVTEQIVPSGRSPVGSSVIDEPGEPLTVKLCGVPAGQSSVNELVVAVTGSLKLTTMFVFAATWSGGSPLSTSLMLAATAVTVQLAVGRSLFGSSVIPEVPEPVTWKVCRLPSHTIVNELESTVTASLKVKVMFVFAATSVAPSAGEWAVTAGAESVVKENE